jgi:hypothetical protein
MPPWRRALKRGAAKLAALRYAQTDAAPDPFQALATWRRRRASTSKTTATATAPRINPLFLLDRLERAGPQGHNCHDAIVALADRAEILL